MENKKIYDVATFLKKVSARIRQYDNQKWIFLYRGESKEYEKPCIPNIFRAELMVNNPFFEKNLFDTMRQHKLSGEKNYLENAIDAQHGEFPSRLLDVTYNCLIALYFAVTPYYHNEESKYDNENGKVYIFIIDEIYSPSSENINRCYNAIVNRENDWFTDNIIFTKNHKFIDHIKLNSRIIAQQGAFVLFQGDDAESIPQYRYFELVIPKEAKRRIRKELKDLFGIYTGSVFPEVVNLTSALSEKSQLINCKEFTIRNELDEVIRNLSNELDYYLQCLLEERDNEKEKYYNICIWFEKILYSYKIGFGEFVMANVKCEKKFYIDQYNLLLEKFSEELKNEEILDFDIDEFKLECE